MTLHNPDCFPKQIVNRDSCNFQTELFVEKEKNEDLQRLKMKWKCILNLEKLFEF